MMYNYEGKVLRVVDGDTLDIDVDLGFKIHHIIRVRLVGVDTPEVYGVKKDSQEYMMGKEASIKVEELCLGKEVLVDTLKDRTGKYGRYLATIHVDGRNLNAMLIEMGYAAIDRS
jgi:micrococcal nuclease